MPYSHPQQVEKHNAFKQAHLLMPGAAALAGSAGYVNSVALDFFHTPVSHMTGAISHFGLDTATGNWADALSILTIIVGFVTGTALIGIIVGAWKLVPGRHYGVAMLVEGCQMGLATFLFASRHRLALPTVSLACGLQNAMSSSYCGLMIRTTHVIGMVTDIEVMMGHWIRHRQIVGWQLSFLLMILVSFGAGCWLGQLVHALFGPACLALPAMGFIVAGTILGLAYHRGVVDLIQYCAPPPLPTASFPKQ